MRRALVFVALAASLAAPAAATLPRTGVLVPGRSLGGVSLGAREAAVRAAWGPRVGICRGCRERTLYFTYRPFDARGAGAAFRRGHAIALFTLWSPPGWRTNRGLRLGEVPARVTELYGALPRTECAGYYALTMPRRRAVTAFYVREGKLWAFGLLRPGVPVCR